MSADDDYVTFRLARADFNNILLKSRLEAQQLSSPEKTADADTQEAEFWRHAPDETRNSLSYKIGRAVTWLPRKIRGW